MILKYTNPWKILIYIIFSIFKSLQVVFVAFIFQQFINFAQLPNGNLLNLTILAVLGLILFSIIGSIYEYIYYKIIEEININLKKISSIYLINSNLEKDIIDSSFMTNDLKQIETNCVEAELSIIFNFIQFIAAVISAFVSSWMIALIFLISSFIPAVVQSIFGPRIEHNSEKWEKLNSKYTDTVIETHSGIKSVNIYDAQSSIIDRLIAAAKTMEKALFQTNWIKGTSNELTMSVAYIFSMILPFAIGIYFIINGKLTLGTFMMISQLANNFINPVVGIFGGINDIKTTKPILQKIKSINSFNKEYKNNNNKAPRAFEQLELANAGVLRNDRPIFSNVNLKIKAGQKVLLEAPSGWGKTTLLNVLIGIYKLDCGSYEIDKFDVNGEWTKLHEYFSFIQQKPFILDDTIKYNITLGRKVLDKDLINAINCSGLKKLVDTYGLDYNVGKNGANLSGGQNQRLEIARALISKRPILIADEATSSLDNKLSNEIHQTILKDYSGTVIEVAHHISSFEKQQFDQIIKLKK